MRKFILLAALVLASTAAQASDKISMITQLPSEEPAAATERKPVETPKYVARPSAVDKAAEQPKSEAKSERAEAKRPVAEKTTRASRTERPRRRDDITEARVIQELNRRGINW